MKTKKPQSLRDQHETGGFWPNTLALAISSALFTGVAVAAEEGNLSLDKLTVEEEVTPDTNPYAEPGAPYLGRISGDVRRTRPLAETPQTIDVLTETLIEDSGRSDLREILDAQPGITLGTGENGNAFGDRYIIRGHEARSDVFVDGLRDPGMTIRESFAVEQVEITKGPSSSFAGRGTTGGAVNSVTKRASTEYDFTKLSAGLGTDDYHRLTVDANKVLGLDTALRVNLLHAEEDVPDREPADRQRRGAAVSLNHWFSDRLEVTLDHYYLDAEDKPDLGTYIDRATMDPVDDIPVYLQDEDFLESEVNSTTLRIGYEVNPKARIVNLTRYGTTDNGYVTTGTRGTTGYLTEADATAGTNGFDTASLSTHDGWQEVEYFANQLNLLTKWQTGRFNHDLVIGTEYSDHKVLNGRYDYTATGASNCWVSGRGGSVNPGYCIWDENGQEVRDLNELMQRDIAKGDWDSDWHVRTLSVYVMDTVDLTDRWTVFGGLRVDHFDYDNKVQRSGTVTDYDYSDTLLNGHLGVSYKFLPNANVYASYSTASNINGGESDLGANCGYGGICVADDPDDLGEPENTRSLELGTKWKLADGKLLLSGAVFEIKKTNVFESATGDSYDILGTLNTGENRVRGIELGLAGNITEKLSAHAGLTVMEAEVLESNNPDNVGKTLANFADESATLHLRYQATPKFSFGGTLTYEGERYTGQPDSAANEDMPIPDYTTLDAFATYNFNRNLRLRLNVTNVTDEDYYLAAYRSGAFVYKGDARRTYATLEYDF